MNTWIKRKLKKDNQDVLFPEGWGGLCASDDWLQSMEQTLITMCGGSLLWTVYCILHISYGVHCRMHSAQLTHLQYTVQCTVQYSTVNSVLSTD